MYKNDKRLESIIKELYQFRSKIPANLTVQKVKEVWGINISQDSIPKIIEPRRNIIEEKTEIAKDSLEWIVLKPFIKFVGISGSIASEFAKDEDDVDLFIVTKNDTVWICRLYIYMKNLFKKKIRSKGNSDVKNKLCINFLVEQRALHFEEDIFNLNELIYLKPLFNEKFLNVIFLNNLWLKEKYMISDKFLGINKLKVGDVKEITRRSFFLFPINLAVFIGQFLFMLITKHEPDLKRLFKGFREGKVGFYPKDFKEEKMGDVKIGLD